MRYDCSISLVIIAYTQTHTYTYIYTLTYTQTHTHINTHTHTYTHTHNIPPQLPQLWKNYFECMISFLTQDCLQLEQFTEAKRTRIISKLALPYLYTAWVAQQAKASDTQAVGHGFELHPDH